MINKVNADIKFSGFFTASGIGATGLTVTVDVWRGATQVITGAAATEIAGGWYDYTLPFGSVTEANLYKATFKTAGTADVQHLPAGAVVGPVEDTWDVVHANHQTVGSVGEALLTATQAGGGQSTLLAKQSTVINNGSTVGGTDANIDEEDGVTWDIESAAGIISVDIVFNAANLYIHEIQLVAGLTSHQSDELAIEAYNEGTTSWDQLDILMPGLGLYSTRTLINQAYVDSSDLCTIRFVSSSLRQTSTLSIDSIKIFTSTEGGYVLTAKQISQTVVSDTIDSVYGQTVYLDTVEGVDPASESEIIAGQTGQPRFPFATLPWAIALADALGKARIRVTRSSEITLASPTIDHHLVNERAVYGNRYKIHLGNQDISDSIFEGAEIDGTFLQAGGFAQFVKCDLRDIIGPAFDVFRGTIAGNITITGAAGGVFDLVKTERSPTPPTITLQNAAAPLYLKSFDGTILLKGLQTGNAVSITGMGMLTIDAGCTGGTIEVEGNFNIVDNSGSVTINDEGNVDRATWLPEQTADIVADPYFVNLDTVVDSRASQTSVDQLQTIVTTTGVVLTAQQVADLVKEILIHDTSTYEDDAQILSITTLIHALLLARLDAVTGDLIIYRTDGVTEWLRIGTETDPNAEPIVAIGTM